MLLTKLGTFSVFVVGLGVFLGPATAQAENPSSSIRPPMSGKVRVPGGEFFPQYGPGGSKKAVHVSLFWMDETPVTERQFHHFVKARRDWNKGAPVQLMAEEKYLSHWKNVKGGKFSPSLRLQEHPVVFVSYFAAAAYCEWRGGRLPTTLEWEYAAQDKPKDILAWFANPKPPSAVKSSRPNHHGLYDLHGQVWEWTQDFNSSFATADSREDGNKDKNFFCGAGAVDARDRENYPAFMRYAMRGALRANYVLSNLGFRCAYDENR